MGFKLIKQVDFNDFDSEKLNNFVDSEIETADLFVAFSYFDGAKTQLIDDLQSLASVISMDVKIIAFEECMEKGGGGFFSGFLEIAAFHDLTLIMEYEVAKALLGCVVDDGWTVGKEFLKRIFTKSRKNTLLRLKTRSGIPVSYLLPHDFDLEKTAEVAQHVLEHYEAIYESQLDFPKAFIYVDEIKSCKEYQ